MPSISELQRQYLAAIDEYTSACTVVITSVNHPGPHGSGVAVTYQGSEYILTAAHVLQIEPVNSDLRIIGRPDAPLNMLHGRQELAAEIARSSGTRQILSAAATITITGRVTATADDIAALKVENLRASLPHTIVHDLSRQAPLNIVTDMPITIFGFPGELAASYQDWDGRRGRRALPHITMQTVVDNSRGPGNVDPTKYFLTDYDYPEDQCDPHGLSGCGGWGFPQIREGEIWSADSTQLLGIETGHYPKSNVLQFVRIDRVIRLLSRGT